MSIAEVCIQKKVVTYCLAVVLLLAGWNAYQTIGRLEDPEFTVKNAQIITFYPGADAEQVAREVTDPIEIAAQQLGELDKVTSTSYPERSVVMVEIKDKYGKNDLPMIWQRLRNKVSEAQLPQGASTPMVVDDFGDVWGVYYAIYGDGYSYAELKEYAKTLKRELLLCDDVARVTFIGDQQENVFLEISRERMAASGITPQQLAAILQGVNQPAAAGHVRIGEKYVRLAPTGTADSVDELGELLIVRASEAGKPAIRLKDIATVRRDYVDPPSSILRRNGKPCIALGISTASGGNVTVMGASVDKRLAELKAQTPIGIEMAEISHQAKSVQAAVSGFMINLVESVIIVVAVLLVAMGLRSGVLIGVVLVVTVMASLMVMKWMGILLERISLGAFIIALGMLVDNAIVIAEGVLVAAQKGRDKVKAAIAIVEQNKWPLLGATAVAVLAFAPIGASQDSTGEYCRSLFLVIMISLLLSWVLAITLMPLLASRFLTAKSAAAGEAPKDPYASTFFRVYRRFLESCIRHKWLTAVILVASLVLAVLGFGHVKQNMFPDSTRNQMMVHVWMPEGTDLRATDARALALTEHISGLDGVTGVTSLAGTSGLRFLLTFTPEDDDSAYSVLFVDLADYHDYDRLAGDIEEWARDHVSDALVYAQRFTLGPGDPLKLQLRISGPEPEVLRRYADRVMDVLRADGRVSNIQTDWRNRVELVRPLVNEQRARNLGLGRDDVAAAFRRATEGITVGAYKEGDETLPIVLRQPDVERHDPDSLFSAWLFADTLGRAIPAAQVVDGFDYVSEEARLGRRNRLPCITVKCAEAPDETAADAFNRLEAPILAVLATLPEGYSFEWGGEHEQSEDSHAALGSKLPVIGLAMLLIVVVLFNSIKKAMVIFLTVPLILVGVVVGLLGFDQPFGFMAILGFLSLAGMQIKNAIVLIDEINAQTAAGARPFDAVVSAGVTRLRPVMLGAVTTIFGMLPLVTDAFYVAMAVTIMCGLTVATVLTMVVIPVNYALLFRIRDDTPAVR